MTVPATPRRAGPFTGNGATTLFGFGFKTFSEDDLRVVLLNTTTGLESDAVLNSDYTVALNPDQESNPGGTLTFAVAPASDIKITIVSLMSYAQPVDLPDGGAYRAQQVEDGLDRLAILVQQLDEENSRSLRVPVSVGGVNPELPTPAAFQLIGWNSTGNELANYDATALGVSVMYASWRTQVFNGTGALASFVLDFDAGSASNIDLRVNNVPQTPGVNYSYNNVNRTITFLTGAPPSGTGNVVARYGQGLSEANIDAAIASAQASASTAASSESTAIAQASTATTAASTATTAASTATTQAGIATAAASNAESAWDAFDDRYLGAKAADPTLDNDGNALLVGALYWNTTSSTMRVFGGVSWADVVQGVSTPTQVFNGTGAQTTFTLSGTPGSLASLEVFISGVRQVPTTNYTVSGTTLTFVVAPPAGTGNVFVRWISTQAINVPADGSVTIPKIAATGTPNATTFLRGDGTWASVSTTGRLIAITRFTASGTWTKNSATTQIYVEAMGGGGGGGGAGSASVGGSGGSGGVLTSAFSAAPPASAAVTIGGGGTGAAGNGNAGGTTSLAGVVSAAGGAGGAQGGGGAVGGCGVSPRGTNGGGNGGGQGTASSAAANTGGGGGGGTTAGGGNGGSGFLIVWEFA